MQIHTGEKPICGNNLHIFVYECELKKEMSPITHCVYVLNSVRSLKLQRHHYVFVGFNRTHLIMLTISVITAGQLNVNS